MAEIERGFLFQMKTGIMAHGNSRSETVRMVVITVGRRVLALNVVTYICFDYILVISVFSFDEFRGFPCKPFNISVNVRVRVSRLNVSVLTSKTRRLFILLERFEINFYFLCKYFTVLAVFHTD